MDSILTEITSSEFWAGVLLGQFLFIGGILYLCSGFSNSSVSNKPENISRSKDC